MSKDLDAITDWTFAAHWLPESATPQERIAWYTACATGEVVEYVKRVKVDGERRWHDSDVWLMERGFVYGPSVILIWEHCLAWLKELDVRHDGP